MKKVSIQEPLKHYQWGDACDGWNLVDETSLSVKKERMPAGTAETLHYHEYAQQFFYVLQGEASFEIDGQVTIVKEKEGIHILPGEKHRIVNHSMAAVEFLLSSQPSTANDRINL